MKEYIRRKLQTLFFGTDFTLDDYVYVEPQRKERQLKIQRTIIPERVSFNETFLNAHKQLNGKINK